MINANEAESRWLAATLLRAVAENSINDIGLHLSTCSSIALIDRLDPLKNAPEDVPLREKYKFH